MRRKPTYSGPSAEFYTARVYLAQARHFRRLHRSFAFTLLDWAASARRRGVAKAIPQQMGLFANVQRKAVAA